MKKFKTKDEYLEYFLDKKLIGKALYIISIVLLLVHGYFIIHDYFEIGVNIITISTVLLSPILAYGIAQIAIYFLFHNTFANNIFGNIIIVVFYYYTVNIVRYLLDDYMLQTPESINGFTLVISIGLLFSAGASIFGFLISIPLKLIDYYILGSREFYYSSPDLTMIHKEYIKDGTYRVKEKHLSTVNSSSQPKKYSQEKSNNMESQLMSLSEIELEIKLQNAVEAEDYELAEIIKKVLKDK